MVYWLTTVTLCAGVIHLVTAADGAEKHYKFGHTTDDAGLAVFRRETPAIAREV